MARKSPKIIEAEKLDGTLMSVSLELQDPTEITAYQLFLASEMLECGKCHAENNPKEFRPIIKVDSPLANSILSMAEPIVVCPHCGERIKTAMMDYTAFPSVVAFLRSLQMKYLAAKGSKAHG